MTRWWQQRRYGLLVQANLATVPAWAPIGQYADWYRAHLDGECSDTLLHPSPMVETIAHHRDRWDHVAHYDDFAKLLTFDQFDADQWAQLAVDGGMSYSVIVAKHHDGLCWWDAPATERTTLHMGPMRNVLGEYAEACRQVGVAFGTYYSMLDWSDPRYPSARYVDQVVHPHVLDLVERYGSRMLWGDGHWGAGGGHWRSDDLIASARKIDPDVVVNDRWWSDGPGVKSFEYRLPNSIVRSPWEMRRGLGPSFGHNRAERDEHLLSAKAVISLLTEVVAKGGHLLLCVGPDASGRMPEQRAAIVRTAGQWVRRHQHLIDSAVPWSAWGDDSVRYLLADDVLHAVDVAGRGRFEALGRGAGRGRVRAVSDISGNEPMVVEFEQLDTELRLTRRGASGSDVRVYQIDLEPPPPAPIELFATGTAEPIELAGALAGARRGHIVQLGEAQYVGPAHVPDGVTVRGLGPHRTVLDGGEQRAVTLGAGARVEHCTITGGGNRIVWLPKPVVELSGQGASLLGCAVDGHAEIGGDDCKIGSCTITGVVASGVERVTVSRTSFTGMNWDCAIDVAHGSGHLVEGCEFADVLEAVRLTGTTGATVRGNRIRGRWWGVRAIDTEATRVVANYVASTMRAVDIDGGSLAEITGNAVLDGDSGCIVQRGAAGTVVTGNRWERTRIGVLAWDAGPVASHDNTAVDLAEPESANVVGP